MPEANEIGRLGALIDPSVDYDDEAPETDDNESPVTDEEIEDHNRAVVNAMSIARLSPEQLSRLEAAVGKEGLERIRQVHLRQKEIFG